MCTAAKLTRVGIRRANFAAFIFYLRKCFSQLHICIGFTHLFRLAKSILLSFWWGNGLSLVCLTVKENAGSPDKYRISMDYEYQEKKKEIY
jgi:hypothetical protein